MTNEQSVSHLSIKRIKIEIIVFKTLINFSGKSLEVSPQRSIVLTIKGIKKKAIPDVKVNVCNTILSGRSKWQVSPGESLYIINSYTFQNSITNYTN